MNITAFGKAFPGDIHAEEKLFPDYSDDIPSMICLIVDSQRKIRGASYPF
jgi:hypothetical protein